jgi:hypothetical protein
LRPAHLQRCLPPVVAPDIMLVTDGCDRISSSEMLLRSALGACPHQTRRTKKKPGEAWLS